jgi:hypothetical protein
MEVYGEGGILVSLVVLKGWVYGKTLGRGWGKFCSHTKFDVGDGYKISFWHDRWCGDIALKEAFPIYLVLLMQRMLLLGRSCIFWRCHLVECELC